MGKKAKVGKQRKDHYYTLAKQQGYRARSAYKLTQLGNKFNLFDDTTFVIDLCAAPGGWMQVARQSVPMAGHVFGVDLFPIKPIKGCTSIQADITTGRCEKLLNEALNRQSVPDRQVDLVLHDGAPNVGSSWDRDAYNQNDLVLKSLHLATKYLKPHGTFVTKVFRSADYTKLLYVFEQLFKQVTPTKPSSSRDVSAEIFVVCKGYKAPQKISTALFDVAKVFEQIEEAVATAHGDALNKSELIAKSLIPALEKSKLSMGGLKAALAGVSKKNRGGYEPGDEFRKCSVRQFFESAMPAQVLVHHHRIEFNKDDPFDKLVYEDPSTTTVIKEALEDLKLVGKADLRMLLRWRLKYLQSIVSTKAEKLVVVGAAKSNAEKLDELLQLEAKEKLKALRKARKRMHRLEQKMQMATAVFEPETEDVELFGSGALSAKILEEEDAIREVGPDASETSDSEKLEASSLEASEDEDFEVDYTEQLAKELSELHQNTQENKALEAAKKEQKGKRETRRKRMYQEWAEEMKEFVAGIQQRAREPSMAETGDLDSEDEAMPAHVKEMPVTTNASESSEDEHSDAGDSFAGSELSDSELPEIPLSEKKMRHLRRVKETARREHMAAKKAKKDAQLLSSLGGKVDSTLQAEAEGTATKTQIRTVRAHVVDSAMAAPESFEEMAEIQAIGQQLSKKKSRMDVIDGMYNRYAFDDAPHALPDWFKVDDKKARVFDTAMTKELAAEYRAKLKEISERPIRKVAEARARKKARGDKSQRKKRDKTYATVSKRGGAKHYSARSGKKSGGHVVTVDRRLKKDKRGAKATLGRKKRAH